MQSVKIIAHLKPVTALLCEI